MFPGPWSSVRLVAKINRKELREISRKEKKKKTGKLLNQSRLRVENCLLVCFEVFQTGSLWARLISNLQRSSCLGLSKLGVTGNKHVHPAKRQQPKLIFESVVRDLDKRSSFFLLGISLEWVMLRVVLNLGNKPTP